MHSHQAKTARRASNVSSVEPLTGPQSEEIPAPDAVQSSNPESCQPLGAADAVSGMPRPERSSTR